MVKRVEPASIKVYCSKSLWDATGKLAEAHGVTRGKAVRAYLEELAPQFEDVAKVIVEARAGRRAGFADRMTSAFANAFRPLVNAAAEGSGAEVPHQKGHNRRGSTR